LEEIEEILKATLSKFIIFRRCGVVVVCICLTQVTHQMSAS